MKEGKLEIIGNSLKEMSTHAIKRSNLIAAKLSINSTDLEALEVLLRYGKSTAGLLATETGISGGAVTKMIDRLEKANLVKRENDTVDRRKVYVVLNMEMIHKNVLPFYQPLIIATNNLLSTYTEHELDLISTFLEKSLKLSNDDMMSLGS